VKPWGEDMVNNKQNYLLKGALILSIAGMISKILSAFYRVPLQNLTGDLGYYVYQQIYPFIGIFMMLSLYGFPAAVSKLTIERKIKRENMSFKNFTRPIIIILFIFSLLLAVCLFSFSPFLAEMIEDEKLIPSYQLLSLSFLLIPLLSFYRGYFQGMGDMRPTAYSQVLDQIFRVCIIIVTAILINKGLINTYSLSIWAVYATILGGIIGTSVLLFFKYREPSITNHKTNNKIPWRYFINVLFMFGIIAALNHMVLLLLQLADIFTLVPELINYGHDKSDAMGIKGIFDRGQPLIQFGAVLGSSFALALIPEITQKKAKSKQKTIQIIKDSLTISFYLAAGATLGLILIFPEANLLLFENKSGTGSLQVLMLSILLGSIAITSNAVLQSYGYFKQITLYIIGMFAIKYFLNYLLVAKLGIIGSSLATVISLLFLSGLSLLFLKNKITKQSFLKMINWRAFIYAALCMSTSLLAFKYSLANLVSEWRFLLFIYIIVVVSVGAMIYLLLLLRFNALSQRQLNTLPLTTIIFKIEKIAKFKRR